MMTRIATLATLMTLVGCGTADQQGAVTDVTITAETMIGKWEARSSSEIIDLQADGVAEYESASIAKSTVAWRVGEYQGSQYLTLVIDGRTPQRIVSVDETTIELAPGGVYDLAPEASAVVESIDCVPAALTVHACAGSRTEFRCVDSRFNVVSDCVFSRGDTRRDVAGNLTGGPDYTCSSTCN